MKRPNPPFPIEPKRRGRDEAEPRRTALFALLLVVTSLSLRAQTPNPPASPAPATPPSGQALDPLSLGWPRSIATNGYELAVYQPQIAKWPGNQIEGRFAMAVRPAGTSNETYGVVFFKARTEVDKFTRLVTLEDFQITKIDFPTQRANQKLYQSIIQSELPRTAKTIPLDHLEATFAVSAEVDKAKIQKIDNTPPRIIYTTAPSLLALVDGPPILKPLAGDYERVVNTRSVLLLSTNLYTPGYYLYAASNWYSAPSIEGPWAVNISPPGNINTALEAAMATKQVDPAYPRTPLATPPAIFVSTTPTELLQCRGTANLLSVAGTDLLYVSNSDNAIFYYLDDANYYVLISGRWFKCQSLYGPWSYVAAGTLPADFKKIPPDSPRSNVLLSVPGTAQAQEAVIANSIPQTATVYRDQPKLTVEYAGAPSFIAVPGTSLLYAANTATPVIMVSSKSYYSCQGGIWFVASSSLGPWAVATSVPSAIYTIPPTCPVHYVTYAYVYGYTPTVVYVGYTPGYMGVVVAPSGVVVYGTGYVYPPVVVGTTYVSYPPTYGSGAAFAMGAAVGFAFGYCAGHSTSCYYEPHWGCYAYTYPYHYSYAGYNVNGCSQYTHWGTSVQSSYGASYNASSGTTSAYRNSSSYNPYTGASGSYHANASFNPYSGNASGSRNASYNNPTTGGSFSGSASGSGNIYSGNYSGSRTTDYNNSKTGTSVDSQASVSGNAYNGTETVNRSGTAQNSQTGNSASWNNGTVTADKNGNTYTSGDTAQNKATAQSQAQSSKSSAPSAWGGKPSSSESWGNPWGQSSPQSKSSSAQNSWSSRESSAQSTGSQRFNNYHSSGSGGWGGEDRGGGGGWGSEDRSGGGWGGGGGGGWSRGGGGGFRR